MKLIKIFLSFLMISTFCNCKDGNVAKQTVNVKNLHPIYSLYNSNSIRVNELERAKKQKIDYGKAKTLSLVNVKEETLKGSSIIDTCWYVPLETKERSLVGGVQKMLVEGKHIFIMDNRNTKSIFVFNIEGKFIGKVQNIGRGPHEYSSIRDFVVDTKNKHIIIHDDFLAKLFYYDYQGEFVKKEKTTFGFSHFSKVKNTMYYYTGYADNEHLSFLENNYLIQEKEGVFTKLAINHPKYKLRYKAKNQMFSSGNHLSVTIPVMDNHIYSIENDEIVASYKIDFGDKTIMASDLNKDYETNILSASKKDGKSLFSGDHCETQDILFFRYIENGRYKYVFYNKLNNEITVANNFFPDDKYTLSNILGITHALYDENTFITVMEPSMLTDNKDFINSKMGGLKQDSCKKLVNSLSEIDNPVLCFFKLKNI